MNSILSIIEDLASTTKRLEKLAILEKNKDNENLKKVFKYALDPHITFYIKKIPDYNYIKDVYDDNVFLYLDKFASRELTGGAAIKALTTLLESTSPEVAELVERIIKKDLRCGVSTATANKIYGKDFIKKFPCMLASSMNEKNLSKISYPAFVQTKMDGMRAMIVVKEGNVTVYSRGGKIIDVSSQFEDLNIYGAGNFVLDGELLVVQDKKILDRKTGNGILNKALKGTISDEERSMVGMTAWDYIPYDDFINDVCDMPLSNRMYYLEGIVSGKGNVWEIDNNIVADYKTASKIFQEKLAKGEEGVIIKNTDSLWVNKRSHDYVKMKEILEADLMIIDMHEGTGKYENMLGAMVVKDKNHDMEVAVGTGFSDEQRNDLWINRNTLHGKIVSVQYNAKISSKGSELDRLFLPVFVEVREDKDEADAL